MGFITADPLIVEHILKTRFESYYIKATTPLTSSTTSSAAAASSTPTATTPLISIMDEIRRVRAKKSSSSSEKDTILFTLEEVKEMNYFHAVLSETLRLYPPAPLQLRTSNEKDVLPGGLKVAKNQLVIYITRTRWGGQRKSGDRIAWPERWLSSESGEYRPVVSPYEYPVFHAGPRMCLGKDMAYIQMKMVAVSVMERFEVEVVDAAKKKREPELLFILKMKEGLKVRVRERVINQGPCVCICISFI